MNCSLYIDYYDLIWKSESLFDENRIDQFLGRCAEAGISSVFWRVSVCGALLYHTELPDRFDMFTPDYEGEVWRKDIHDKVSAVLQRFDPMAVACRLARKHGLRIMPWLTLYDDYGPRGNHPSSFQRNHPEFCWKHIEKDEYIPGIVSYAYIESVEFRMKQIRELLSYDVDGILLSVGSHSRAPAYLHSQQLWLEEHPDKNIRDFNIANPGLWKKFQKESLGKFGFDPPAVEAFSLLYGHMPESNDADWWAFRGNYLMDFLRKVRQELTRKDQTISIYYRSSELQQNRLIPESFFQWSKLANSGIVDEIHYLIPDTTEDLSLHFPELSTDSNPRAHATFWMGLNDFKGNKARASVVRNAIEERQFTGVSFFEAMSFFCHEENWKYIEEFNQI